MDIDHLSRFDSTVKERATAAWKLAVVQSERWLQWLQFKPQVRTTLFSAGMGIVTLLLLIFSGVTAAVAALTAWFALIRHFAQTNADRQRRITESFSKAVEQLGSDKLEVRLGGIYSLERISKESADDYWTVMENLTAFVRERSRRNEAERMSQDAEQRIARCAYLLWQEAGRPDGWDKDFWAKAVKQDELGDPPAADIAAVLTVINRRVEQNRQNWEREDTNGWRLDLSHAVLKQANLMDARLEGASLWGAHMEGASLWRARLEGANLMDAHLERSDLWGAHLEGASLWGAHLEGASLMGAHLKGANFMDAHLEGASLMGTPLEGASLMGTPMERRAELWRAHMERANLREEDLVGDAVTRLPVGVDRPAHWPEPTTEAGAEDPG